jgi:exodeoxyribonuclease III
MRFATWNVNSLKVRMPRIEAWLAEVQPDVVCMQETKVADAAFPSLAFSGLGYDAAHHGQGQWNGVAILSRVGIADVTTGFAADLEADVDARLISATCGAVRVHSVYVPNGRAVGHEQYHYKLSWLARLRGHLELTLKPADPVIVAGDFNVAPEDRDVYDPVKFEGETHVTPPERDALAAIEDWGLDDVFRRHYADGGIYSWWDYRAGDFHQGRGLRIDLVLASERLRSTWCVIDRNARKGQQPSDHAPVVVELDVT